MEGVWAVGDCVRGPMLAHKGKEEGVMVADLIAGSYARSTTRSIPAVIYTAPEIAWVGQTEEQVKASGRSYKVGVFPFAASGRARAMERRPDLPNCIAAKDDDDSRRAHHRTHGRRAHRRGGPGDGISASDEDLQRTIHAHPTLAGALHEAALAADKRAIDNINRWVPGGSAHPARTARNTLGPPRRLSTLTQLRRVAHRT